MLYGLCICIEKPSRLVAALLENLVSLNPCFLPCLSVLSFKQSMTKDFESHVLAVARYPPVLSFSLGIKDCLALPRIRSHVCRERDFCSALMSLVARLCNQRGSRTLAVGVRGWVLQGCILGVVACDSSYT